MAAIDRLKTRLGEGVGATDALLTDLLETAKAAILARRYPFEETDGRELDYRYEDLQVRIAIDLYNKMGAEGQIMHNENNIQRTWQSSWISDDLLREVVPMAGVFK